MLKKEKKDKDILKIGWVLNNWRPIKPFAVKGQQRLFNVDDRLIEYL